MKITSLSNDAIDAMDAFARDWEDGECGSYADHLNALQRILDAGVEVEAESAVMGDGHGKHTPTPWRQANKHPRHICDARGFKIAKCLLETKGANFVISEAEGLANAARIVRCVNKYDNLVEAVKQLCEVIEKDLGVPPCIGSSVPMESALGAALNAIKEG